MQPDAPLATPRLDLEPLRAAHARELYPALCDPALYAFLDEDPPASLAALEARYRILERRAPPDGRDQVWLNWACRERASGRLAGLVQATLAPGAPALIAYVFTAAGQGRGLAREACRALVHALFTDWRQEEIAASVDPRNARSIALLAALGFARDPAPAASGDLRFRTRRARGSGEPPGPRAGGR